LKDFYSRSKGIDNKNALLSQFDQAARVCYDSYYKTANALRWLQYFFQPPPSPDKQEAGVLFFHCSMLGIIEQSGWAVFNRTVIKFYCGHERAMGWVK